MPFGTLLEYDIWPPPDQEKILALLAAWSFDRKPTAECGNFSIKKILSITKQAGAELGQAQLPTGILLYCD